MQILKRKLKITKTVSISFWTIVAKFNLAVLKKKKKAKKNSENLFLKKKQTEKKHSFLTNNAW